MQIQDAVYSRSLPYVTTEVFLAWEKIPKIRKSYLTLDLKRAEFKDRFLNRKGLENNTDKLFD